jgi:hypothetical protein
LLDSIASCSFSPYNRAVRIVVHEPSAAGGARFIVLENDFGQKDVSLKEGEAYFLGPGNWAFIPRRWTEKGRHPLPISATAWLTEE